MSIYCVGWDWIQQSNTFELFSKCTYCVECD